MHFTQQSKVNLATLRSSGVYHSITGSPLSSIRPVPSTTTTTTTPARKSKTKLCMIIIISKQISERKKKEMFYFSISYFTFNKKK